MRVNYLMGCIYRDLNWPTEAQLYFHKAIAAFSDKTQTTEAQILLSRIYGQMGDLYHYKSKTELSIKMYYQAIKYSEQCNDSIFRYTSLKRLASCLLEEGDTLKAIKAYKEAYVNLTKLKEQNAAYACLLHLSLIYTNQSKDKQAEDCINKFEHYMRMNAPSYIEKYSKNTGTYYSCKASYYYTINKIDSAIHYYKELLKSNGGDYREEAYDRLAFCYAIQGNKDSVIKYQDSYIQGFQDKKETAIAVQLQELQSHFDIMSEREKAANAIIQKQKIKINIYILVILFGFVIAIVAILYVRKKKKYTKLLKEYQKAIYDAKIEKEKMNILITNNIHRELESQKRKVSETIKKAQSIEEKLSPEELVQMRLDTFQQTTIVVHFLNCSIHNKKIEEKDWISLFEIISEVAPPVAKFLREHRARMQDSDYRMFMLVIVGIPPKHIKQLLYCTYQKISMQRKRYFKIFFGKDGKPTDFDFTLRSIQ